jgi:hypothetical protein
MPKSASAWIRVILWTVATVAVIYIASLIPISWIPEPLQPKWQATGKSLGELGEAWDRLMRVITPGR